MSRHRILILAWVLFIGLTFISWLGFFLGGKPLVSVLTAGSPFAFQLALGLLLGFLVSGSGMLLVLRAAVFRGYRETVATVLGEIQPRWTDLVFVSIGAGWSEELFFRGLLQPHLGVWVAAGIFWLAHGAISSTHRGINLYGLCVFFAGVCLGYLCEAYGLVAAMAAHAAMDATTLLGFHLWMGRRVPAKSGGNSTHPEEYD